MDALKQNPNRMAAYPFRAVRREGNSLILDSINATLTLTPYASSMIRVTYHRAGAQIPEAKCIENRKTTDKWKFKDTPDTVLLATSALYLRIDKKNGLISFCDKDKNVLLNEKQPGHILETTKTEVYASSTLTAHRSSTPSVQATATSFRSTALQDIYLSERAG